MSDEAPSDPLSLVDWRRRVSDLYAAVRSQLPEDPRGAHRRWREGRDALFATHPQSPLEPADVAEFSGLDVWPYDPGLVFTAPLDTDVAPDRYPVATSGGSTIDVVRVARVRLELGDLDVMWFATYAGGLFLPFRDATAGDETYGGGRYLLDTAKGADLGTDDRGHLVLDFNFSYAPSCAYAPAWSCPLAPPGNGLDVEIRAGERRFGR